VPFLAVSAAWAGVPIRPATPGPGTAPPAAEPAEPVESDDLTALTAPDLAEREDAQRRLATMLEALPGSLVALEATLRRTDLSPEQRARLEQIGAELYRAEPKAAMGVQFGGRATAGVRIGGVLEGPNFPAAKLLRAGDVLTHADGRVLLSADQLRWIILSHAPGEVLPVRLLRGEGDAAATLDIDVPLGAFEDLSGAASVDEPTLRAAYAERLRRVAPADEIAIGSGLSAEAFLEHADTGAAPLARVAPGVFTAGVGASPALPAARLDAPLGASALLRAATLGSAEAVERYAALLAEREGLLRMQRADAAMLSRPDLSNVASEIVRFRLEERGMRLAELEAQLSALTAGQTGPAERDAPRAP
jgi:hypothetical protein